MAYFIEFGLDHRAGLYEEFLIVDKNTGLPISAGSIDHQFFVFREIYEYGRYCDHGQLVASNSNGLITAPAAGVLAMNIPPDAFCSFNNYFDAGWYDFRERPMAVLRCKMLAVPSDPTLTKTLFTGTLSFGDRVMSNPRVKLGVYPLYPSNSSKASIGRTAIIDSSYFIQTTDFLVAMTALTAPRVFNLPLASTYPVGQPLYVTDESGACSSSKTITIATTGADTIAGLPSIALASPYQKNVLQSNGINLWTYS